MLRWLSIGACALAVGCSGNQSTERPYDQQLEANSNLEVPVSKPRYASREGNVYLYTAAVSEEDAKKGRAAGEVLMFRYLGFEDGKHRLQMLNDSEKPIATAECPTDCKVIKQRWIDGATTRSAYSSESVIGSVFDDARDGHLEPSRATADKASSAATPTAATQIADDRIDAGSETDEPVQQASDLPTDLNAGETTTDEARNKPLAGG